MTLFKSHRRWTRIGGFALLFLLVLGVRADGAAGFSASIQRSSGQEDDGRRKWDRLSREEKEKLRKKFEYFKSLPDSEKRLLHERHGKLRAIREGLQDRNDADKKSSYRKVRTFLKDRLDAVKKMVESADTENGDDRAGHVRALRRELERRNSKRLKPFLEQMVREGMVSPEEAEKIKTASPRDRVDELFSMGKRRHLREVEGMLPPNEADRLEKMEPWRFHRHMRSDREHWNSRRIGARLGALTPEQEESLGDLRGSERMRQHRRMTEENLRSRLEMIGVGLGELKEVSAQPRSEQDRWIEGKLKALENAGIRIPPSQQGGFRSQFREDAHSGERSGEPEHEQRRRRTERGKRAPGNRNP